METRANYAIIGVFTLAVIAAGFLFVYWFSGSDSSTKRQPVRVVFEGSVAGLNKGSAVLFNGIRVGDVTRVFFDKQQPQQAFAEIAVDRETPIRTDTKARLDVALLSGSALVALTGGDSDAPPLTAKPDESMPTIVAEGSGFASILEQARGTAEKAATLLDQVSGIVNENRASIGTTLKNVEAFSDALGKSAPTIDRALTSIGTAAEKIGPLAIKLETLTDSVTGVVKGVDPKQVTAIVDNTSAVMKNASAVMKTVADKRAEIDGVLMDAASLSKRLNDTAPKLDQALTSATNAFTGIAPLAGKLETLTDNVAGVVKAVDPKQVTTIVDNTSAVMKTIGDNRAQINSVLVDVASLSKRLNETAPKLDQALTGATNVLAGIDPAKIGRVVDNADKFAAAIGNSSKDAEAAVRNAAALTDKLNRAADRVDGVLKAAENFLGSAAGKEGQGTFTSIREAANSVRKTADNLDKRFLEISTALSRFTGSGAKQVEAVATDTRRTVNDVGRAARKLERNPSSVIFGGSQSTLPTYNGR